MKQMKKKSVLGFLIILLLLTWSENGNSQVIVDKLETLPDKTIIVEVGAVTYRGLPPEKMRQILKDKAELESLRLRFANLLKSKADQKSGFEALISKNAEIHKVELEKITGNRDFWKSERDKELKLRTDLSKQVKSMYAQCTGRFLKIRVCTFK